MKSDYSKEWQASKKPDKQRKYVYNAPLHTRGKMMASPLSKALRKKHQKRSIRIRTGDKVKILRGQFKGKIGVIDKVDLARYRVYIEKIETIKKDGTKTQYPIHPSNLIVTELNTEDKKRLVTAKPADKPAKKAAPAKPVPKATPKAAPAAKEVPKEVPDKLNKVKK